MNGAEMIAAERQRQMEVEGWTPEHDDQHEYGEMAAAAQCYLEAKPHQFQHNIRRWPWHAKWWKPKDRISNLVRAGALIAAEIDRIQRTGACLPR
jgi:predicted RNase H-like nuclease (RuvC/YqgF family)